jgi:hypothetical protein
MIKVYTKSHSFGVFEVIKINSPATYVERFRNNKAKKKGLKILGRQVGVWGR